MLSCFLFSSIFHFARFAVTSDDNAHVILKFLENDRRVRETVYGHEYKIRAELTKPNGN